MIRASLMTTCGLLAMVGIAIAQPATPPKPQPPIAPSTAKPVAQPPASDASAPKTVAQTDGYPSFITKQLWSSNDLRGKQAPKLQVETWYGGIKAPDFKNKTLLIDFWFIGCPPCRALIPELEAFQEKYKDDLVVVGLTATDSIKAIADFEDLRGAKIKYAIARDDKSQTTKEVGVQGFPHVLIISSDSVVRWQGFPQSTDEILTEATLKQIIDADKAARAKRTPATPDPKKSDKPADTKPEEPKPAGK